MQLIAKRTLYSTTAFGPVIFNESFMAEDKRRIEEVFGPWVNHVVCERIYGLSLGGGALLYYRHMSPKKIVELSEKNRINYVVFDIRHGFPPHFKLMPHRFFNNKYIIYSVKEIRLFHHLMLNSSTSNTNIPEGKPERP